jgi:Xaa-Pro aminopeptidase
MQRVAAQVVVVGPTANLRYLLGYQATAVERLTVLLATPSSALMIMPDFDEAEFRAITEFPGDVYPWSDNHGPDRAVDRAFRDLGVSPHARALIDDGLPYGFLHTLGRWLGDSGMEPAGQLLGSMRMRKSAQELVVMRAAGEIVSRALDRALAVIDRDQSERRVAEEIRRFLIEAGAESADYILVQAGAASAAPHHIPDERRIQSKEPVLVDIAARVGGYFADVTQQVFLGEPPPEYTAAYDAVAAAHAEALRRIRPGFPIHEIDAASNDVLEGHGFPREARTGHGIGLDVHEPPYLVAGDHTVLEPGMVFTVEPGVYRLGRFGVRIEDTVLVTDDGATALTTAAPQLMTKP